jgi:TIR domain
LADVFISYASEDRERARVIAQALGDRGWMVWGDREIPVGRSYSEVIEHELMTAACVVVLWSKASVKSPWVLNEAREGSMRHVLVPILIEDVRPPLDFRHLQTASLVEWDGESGNADFAAVESAIALFARSTNVQPPVAVRSAASPAHAFKRNALVVLPGIVIAVLVGLFALSRKETVTDARKTETAVKETAAAEPPQAVEPAALPWTSGVGRIVKGGDMQCTAFLVSRNFALMPPPCQRSGEALALQLGSDSYRVRLADIRPDRWFALLALEEPAGPPHQFIPVNVRQARVGESILVAGYSLQSPRAVIHRARVIDVRADAIIYTAPTELGSMGAPVIAVSDNALLGMHHGRDPKDRTMKRAVPAILISESMLNKIH